MEQAVIVPLPDKMLLIVAEDDRKRWVCRRCCSTSKGVYLPWVTREEVALLAANHAKRNHRETS